MEGVNIKWTTEYISSENLVIHTFSDRVKVVSNLLTGELKTLKDYQVIDRRDIKETDYEKFLISVAKDAEILKSFGSYGLE